MQCKQHTFEPISACPACMLHGDEDCPWKLLLYVSLAILARFSQLNSSMAGGAGKPKAHRHRRKRDSLEEGKLAAEKEPLVGNIPVHIVTARGPIRATLEWEALIITLTVCFYHDAIVESCLA